MSNSNKHYDKYYVKRNPATQEVIVIDSEPKLGELAKHDCPLEERHVRVLNKGWQNSGVYFVEIEPETIESNSDEKSQTRAALEKEADLLGVSFRSTIGDDKLQLKINEKKE